MAGKGFLVKVKLELHAVSINKKEFRNLSNHFPHFIISNSILKTFLEHERVFMLELVKIHEASSCLTYIHYVF